MRHFFAIALIVVSFFVGACDSVNLPGTENQDCEPQVQLVEKTEYIRDGNVTYCVEDSDCDLGLSCLQLEDSDKFACVDSGLHYCETDDDCENGLCVAIDGVDETVCTVEILVETEWVCPFAQFDGLEYDAYFRIGNPVHIVTTYIPSSCQLVFLQAGDSVASDAWTYEFSVDTDGNVVGYGYWVDSYVSITYFSPARVSFVETSEETGSSEIDFVVSYN